MNWPLLQDDCHLYRWRTLTSSTLRSILRLYGYYKPNLSSHFLQLWSIVREAMRTEEHGIKDQLIYGLARSPVCETGYANKCWNRTAAGCVVFLVKAMWLLQKSFFALVKRQSWNSRYFIYFWTYLYAARTGSDPSTVIDKNRVVSSRREMPSFLPLISMPERLRILKCRKRKFATSIKRWLRWGLLSVKTTIALNATSGLYWLQFFSFYDFLLSENEETPCAVLVTLFKMVLSFSFFFSVLGRPSCLVTPHIKRGSQPMQPLQPSEGHAALEADKPYQGDARTQLHR